MAAILPFFLVLVFITPSLMYFTGESFFLTNALEFAEVQVNGESVLAATSFQLFLIFVILYLPTSLFSYALWQGMKVVRMVRLQSILSLPLALSVRNIAMTMLGMGILLPLCRFLIPLVYFWPERYFQITILLSDLFLLLTGGLLFVTFHSMLEGIRAENENKEFI